MENQFTTLTKSYYDNFLEYKLTGNESSQKAYMSAEQGIDTILKGLNDEVDSQSSAISNFYKSGVQEKLKSIQTDIQSTQRNIVTNKDNLSAAQMRTPTAPTTASESIPMSYLIMTGVLLVSGALLSAM